MFKCYYNKSRLIFTSFLVLGILGMFYFVCFKNVNPKIEKTGSGIFTGYAANISKNIGNKSSKKVIIYYFHGNMRCSNCHKIETYTKEAYSKIKNKNLELRIINTDEPRDRHFTNDYNLYTKSVVISRVQNEKQVKWKNLDKIWTLLGDKLKFENYIIKETKSYLK